ncbi:hypothetical protein Henu3_gp66 [Mycobacterium phage Henu3]|uniref:Uncharacterized protein n=1 Tax=Mycobacterium phage Henu3 TaxID=2492961 RepID=A0A410T7U6_9CAUD|nr:hypothetical protein I5G68_gp61 [Mycobacterium phage Henu3]QAU05006.1 hypothetical protein Henu3_gp66 [Mycobacterium phage Henu3]
MSGWGTRASRHQISRDVPVNVGRPVRRERGDVAVAQTEAVPPPRLADRHDLGGVIPLRTGHRDAVLVHLVQRADRPNLQGITRRERCGGRGPHGAQRGHIRDVGDADPQAPGRVGVQVHGHARGATAVAPHIGARRRVPVGVGVELRAQRDRRRVIVRVHRRQAQRRPPVHLFAERQQVRRAVDRAAFDTEPAPGRADLLERRRRPARRVGHVEVHAQRHRTDILRCGLHRLANAHPDAVRRRVHQRRLGDRGRQRGLPGQQFGRGLRVDQRRRGDRLASDCGHGERAADRQNADREQRPGVHQHVGGQLARRLIQARPGGDVALHIAEVVDQRHVPGLGVYGVQADVQRSRRRCVATGDEPGDVYQPVLLNAHRRQCQRPGGDGVARTIPRGRQGAAGDGMSVRVVIGTRRSIPVGGGDLRRRGAGGETREAVPRHRLQQRPRK